MDDTHVVFGASGALGSAIVRRLASQGERVRAVVRDPVAAADLFPPSVGIVEGFAGDPESTRAASRGATVIYHCVNVRYSRWVALMPGITANIVEAAREARARLLFPGNVYPYGPLRQTPAREDHPHAATTRKGRLRKELEEQLMAANQEGEVPVVIPRFPDFYGPNVLNPTFASIFEAAVAGKTAGWPGRLDVPHDLINIEDAASASVLLAADVSSYGEVYHVPGPGPVTGRQFLSMVYGAAGTRLEARSLGRLMYRFFGLMIPDAGEMVETLYQFEQPLILDGSKFAAAFPDFRYTSHQEAVARTVEWFKSRVSQGTTAR